MANTLFVLNDPPYGTERSSNEDLTNWVQWSDRTLVF